MSLFTHQCRCLPLRHVVQQISQFLCTAARSLSWTCFISQTHAISLWITCDTDFPKGSCFVSLHGTYVSAWERVFCPRSPQIQSRKQTTPWERCFNKGQSRNFGAVVIRMTRLVKQTRKHHKSTLYSRGGMGLLFSSGKHRFSRVNTAFHG
jgi:hypothetical protein